MIVVYYLLFATIGLICLFIGHSFSKDIDNRYIYVLFWIVYIITLLTLINSIWNMYVYLTINKKKGPVGEKGPKGPDGDEGEEGECEPNCKINLHMNKILEELNKYYNNIIKNARGVKEYNPPKKINNKFIKDTLKRITTSKQFKEIAQTQNVMRIIDYITDIFKKWFDLLANADKSEGKKHFQDYMEIYGETVQWEFITDPENNPFFEIEKYDIYYWGLNKEFHPIRFKNCVDNTKSKSKTNKLDKLESDTQSSDNIRLKVLETNMYKETYNDKGTGAKKSLSVWLTSPIKIEDDTFYPIGSVFHPNREPSSNQRYVKQLGDYPEPYTNKFSVKNRGPSISNVIISDNNKNLVRKPSVDAWSWKWNDKKTGGKQSATFWDAEDFQEDGELFRCFGSMTMPNYNMTTPTQQLGRENVPIVCLNDKMLEEIPNRHNLIWNDKKSGGRYSASAWSNSDGLYNLGYFQKGYLNNTNRKMYKIKKEFMNNNPMEVNKTITHNDSNLSKEVGFQIPDYKYEMNRKNSIFDLLDLVIESDVECLFNGEKINIQHSGLNDPNSYFLKQYNKNSKSLNDYCMKIVEKPSTNIIEIKNSPCNPTKIEQIWELEFIGESTELCYIKSKDNGKYLLSNELNKYTVKGVIDEKNKKQFTWKILSKE